VLTSADGRVEGLERTWAAGDGAVSPVKLGGLATWQAARAAAAIARLAGADVPDVRDEEIVLEGVLMTGEQPYLGEERSAAVDVPDDAVRVAVTASETRRRSAGPAR
jgi:hypothetical protein